MAIGGGMSCVKYLLFCFNLLFAITGLIILIAGIKAQISAHPYQQFTDESFFLSGPIVLIIVGVIIFMIAFFGCCGAAKENHCMIITFSVLLILVFIVELSVGIAGYVKRQDLEQSILGQLQVSIKEYNTNPDMKKSWDVIQTDLKCCGINGSNDWIMNNMTIPDSCCSAQEINGSVVAACSPTMPSFHKPGCLDELVAYLKSIAVVLGGVGIGIAFVQLLGVVFACCLARSIRSQYETV